MFPAPSAPPPPRWERTRHLDPLGRWRRVYRVAQRWRFRRRIAGILLDLCKGVSSLRWSAGPLGEPSRTQRQTRVRRVTREASVISRVFRTILEEDGTVEQALRRLLAAFRLISRAARACGAQAVLSNSGACGVCRKRFRSSFWRRVLRRAT